MRTTAFFCALLLVGFGDFARAADAQYGDPGDLVINPLSPVVELATEGADNLIRFAGVAIDAGEVNLVVQGRMKELLRGTLAESFFQIQDTDPPTLRAVKTFLGELRGRIVSCKGRVVIKLPLQLDRTVVVGQSYDGFTQRSVTRTQKVPWLNGSYPVNGSGLSLAVGVEPGGDADEAKTKGESILYTFHVAIADARVLETGQDDRGTEMDQWTPLEGLTPWECRVRLKRRPARIEEILPKPPTIEVVARPPFLNIDCRGIPRISNLTNIFQEVLMLTTASEQFQYLLARSKKGEVDATCALGRLLWLNQNRRGDALRVLAEAAVSGSGEAAWELAERYANGDEVARDREKALRFYAIASEEGYRALAPKRMEALRAASAPVTPEKPASVQQQP